MPGAPYGGGGAAPPDLAKKVGLWSILAIVSLFCGCGLLGIIPIVISLNAKKAMAAGDLAKAEKDISTVRLLCILGYVGVGLYIVLWVLMMVMGGMGRMMRF